MGESSLQYVTTLTSLVTINILIVEIESFQFVFWYHLTTRLHGHMTLWVEGKAP